MFGMRVLFLSLLATFMCTGVLGDFVCPFPNGLFPDPNPAACVRFYQCGNNVAFLKFCASGSKFDAYKLECVDKHLPVTCGPQEPTEAPPPPEIDLLAVGPCDPSLCSLPHCFCSEDGTQIPGNFTREQTPQMIMITLDGGVNLLNHKLYSSIFLDNRTNPNGCPIRSTFFLSHQYTDYRIVQEFYSQGHEMASGTVTRRAGLEDADVRGWEGELVSMREIMSNYAGVDANDVLGMRAPHLKPGHNAMYDVLLENGFLWDSSLTVPPQEKPVWPYTLDFAIPHFCKSGTCPTHSFPGVWELPMASHYGASVDGGFCPYLDQCVLLYLSEDGVVDWLKADFHRHYDTNRAPYQLTLTTNWFATPELKTALLRFIDYTLTVPDVYYTTMTDALYWITEPVPLATLKKGYSPWDCKAREPRKPACKTAKSCKLTLDRAVAEAAGEGGGVRYMSTCSTCPRKYPWVLDAAGTGKPNDQYTKVV